MTYSSLLQRRRRTLHRRTGEVIESLGAKRLAEQYAVLAHHFLRGEEWGKAFEYLCKAASKAARDFATREAIALYGQALEVTERLGDAVAPTQVMDIHEARSALAHVVSDYAGSRAEAEQMLVLAQGAGDRVREGKALALIAWACTWSRDLDEAIASASQAIEVAKPLDESFVLGRAHYITGFVKAVIGDHDPAVVEIKKALVLSRKARDPVHQSLSLGPAGLLKNWEADYPAAERFQAQGLEIAREHNLLAPLLFNSFVYGITLTGSGSYDEALALFRETLALAEKVGDEAIHHRTLNCLGWLYAEVGNLDRAIEFNQRSSRVGLRRKDPGAFPNAELNLGENFLAREDLVLAGEAFEKIHRYALAPDTSRWMRYRYSIRLYAGLAELWLRRGKPDRGGELSRPEPGSGDSVRAPQKPGSRLAPEGRIRARPERVVRGGRLAAQSLGAGEGDRQSTANVEVPAGSGGVFRGHGEDTRGRRSPPASGGHHRAHEAGSEGSGVSSVRVPGLIARVL